MSENNTHNNSADFVDEGEYFHDTFMNIVAETLVKDVLQDVEQSTEEGATKPTEAEQEEQFYDVTTGLESCKLNDEKSGKNEESDKDKSSSHEGESAYPVGNDTSLTDDEIEVICRYSSPNVATDFKKEYDEMTAILNQQKQKDNCTDDSTKNMPETSPNAGTTQQMENFENGDGQLPPPIMYLPPECYISPTPMRQAVPDPNCYNPSMMYQPLPEHMYSQLLEAQVLQQELANGQTCEQIENGYMAYSTGEPQSPIFTDYMSSIPPGPYSAPHFNEQFPMAGSGGMNCCDYPGEPSPFVYPSIYVSACGLVTVLLRNDTSVEMTIDRTVRIVSHKSKMAVASSSRGNMSVLYHPTVKLYQDGNTTHAQINGVKAKLATEDIWFANEIGSYKFDSNMIEPASPTYRDMSKDDSVNLLFSADTYGEKLVPQCLEAASMAEYENLPKGGVQVKINNVKITQSGRGDVVVVTGPKYLKMSPSNGLIRINTQYIEVTVEKDSSARIRRGGHILTASNNGRVILSNGRIEAGFDEHNRLKVLSLPGRCPLEIGVRRARRQPGPPRRRTSAYLLGEMY